jgi:hypothetical protein
MPSVLLIGVKFAIGVLVRGIESIRTRVAPSKAGMKNALGERKSLDQTPFFVKFLWTLSALFIAPAAVYIPLR